ncbi:MAG: cytidylate kinase-like family protein, partial [Gemmatimonadota bacterium]|nr:cytidylate kinase-like family protein [Gemmatimonadota bacterium]MDQ3606142.1 cytidylate kinase-like family protein [Gemmatimonadota bacterium]
MGGRPDNTTPGARRNASSRAGRRVASGAARRHLPGHGMRRNHDVGTHMALITIARQLGAAGETVATQLADELGWRLLDRALVERIADELAVAPHEVEALNERVETFLERLGSYLSDGLPEVLPAPIAPPLSPELTARAARLVVASVAEEGPAVIVGHGAQCVLEGHPGALHVLLYAQLEV